MASTPRSRFFGPLETWLPLRFVRFVLLWVLNFGFWIVFLSVFLLSFKRLPPETVGRWVRAWGRAALAVIGVRLYLVNPSTMGDRAPRVVITNHQSAMDLIWGAAVCPPGPLVIGKKEVIFIPLLNLAFWLMDFIRIDRSQPAKAIQAISGVAGTIRAGDRSLVMAPEGTRTLTGKMLPFKKGAFHIATQAQVPIHPLVVHGAFELWPKKHFIPSPGTVYMKFLPPVPTAGLGSGDVDPLHAEVQASMASAYESLRQEFPDVRA
jgi:1-acyl-sn-glycerol-3-phosphate acyltransferase